MHAWDHLYLCAIDLGPSFMDMERFITRLPAFSLWYSEVFGCDAIVKSFQGRCLDAGVNFQMYSAAEYCNREDITYRMAWQKGAESPPELGLHSSWNEDRYCSRGKSLHVWE